MGRPLWEGEAGCASLLHGLMGRPCLSSDVEKRSPPDQLQVCNTYYDTWGFAT